jgi:MFS family permease
MKRAIRWYDYITFNVYWFALTARSQVLTPLVLPLLVQGFVGEETKGTYMGTMRLWALMVALLMQALMGMFSDRSTHPWGRRRPFILAGSIGEVIIFMLMGFTAGLEGMTGFWVLFVLYIFSMISSNTAHAATQGIIPDLVPEEKRGRFSGVKALFELPLPLIFVSFVVGKLVAAGNLWGALIALSLAMLASMGIAMLVPEKKLEKDPGPLDWQPILRLLLMTAAFTVIILGAGRGVKVGTAWATDNALSNANVIAILIGLLGMSVAIGLGVWISVRISVGERAEQNPSFTWWVINRLAFLVGVNNIASFVVYFLQEKFPELSGAQAAGPASKLVLFVGVFILLTALPSGWLADRFGRKPVLFFSGLIAAAGTFLLVLATDMTLIYVGGCMIGGGAGFFYTANWALGTDIVPRLQAGRYLGISNLAGAGAGAVGAYIGGPIGDMLGYSLLMAIYGILFLFSLLALFKIKEPHGGTAA